MMKSKLILMSALFASIFANNMIFAEDNLAETISEEITGVYSNCVQHEIDHLNGILMINRLSEFHKSKAMKQLQKFRRGKS